MYDWRDAYMYGDTDLAERVPLPIDKLPTDLKTLSPGARALRITEIIRARHPKLDPNSIAFGAKAMALDLAISLLHGEPTR